MAGLNLPASGEWFGGWNFSKEVVITSGNKYTDTITIEMPRGDLTATVDTVRWLMEMKTPGTAATTTLTISGKGRMPDFIQATNPWNVAAVRANASVRTVIVEEGITGIGSWNFLFESTSWNLLELPTTLEHISLTFPIAGLGRENMVITVAQPNAGGFKMENGMLYRDTSLIRATVNHTSFTNYYGTLTGGSNYVVPAGIKHIADCAFRTASARTGVSLMLPTTLETLGSGVFRTNITYTGITCFAEVPPILRPTTTTNDGMPVFGNNVNATAPVYVPAGSVEAYKAAPYWGAASTFFPTQNVVFTNILPIPTYDITLDVKGDGEGTLKANASLAVAEVDESLTYVKGVHDKIEDIYKGVTVTFTAIPKEGSEVVWNVTMGGVPVAVVPVGDDDDHINGQTITITSLTGDVVATATFWEIIDAEPFYPVVMSITGNGTLQAVVNGSSDPDDIATISTDDLDEADKLEEVDFRAEVVFTATPKAGETIIGWTLKIGAITYNSATMASMLSKVDPTDGSQTLTITVKGEVTVGVTFALANALTVTGGGIGSATGDTEGFFEIGSLVTLVANVPTTPISVSGGAGGWFQSWEFSTDVVFTTGNETTATVTFEMPDEDLTVTANMLTWKITGTRPDQTLTISGNGAIPNQVENQTPWDAIKGTAAIKDIVVEEGITSIGAWMFPFTIASGLATVSLPASLEYWNLINPFLEAPTNITFTVAPGNVGGFRAEHGILRNDTVIIRASVTHADFVAHYGPRSGGANYIIPEGIKHLACNSFRSGTGGTAGTDIKLVLPSTLETFGESVFRNSMTYTEIICYAVVPPIGRPGSRVASPSPNYNFSFLGNSISATTPVYVPASSIDAYRAAPYFGVGGASFTTPLTNFLPIYDTFTVTFSVTGGNGTLAATVGGNAITTGSKVTEGSMVVFTATPNTNFRVKSWTLNSNVVTDSTANTFRLNNLSGNATVSVEFEAASSILANLSTDNALQAWTANGNLHVKGLTIGKAYHVYNTSGVLVFQDIATADIVRIEKFRSLPTGVYVIHSGDHRSIKVVWSEF
jgi:hypothetical protein